MKFRIDILSFKIPDISSFKAYISKKVRKLPIIRTFYVCLKFSTFDEK